MLRLNPDNVLPLIKLDIFEYVKIHKVNLSQNITEYDIKETGLKLYVHDETLMETYFCEFGDGDFEISLQELFAYSLPKKVRTKLLFNLNLFERYGEIE